MTSRVKAILVAAACLVCCISLFLGIIGATTGIAGAFGIWFRRYDLTLLALLGLIAVIAVAVRDRRSKTHEKVSSQ
jgi:hypothetical protein